MTTSVSIGKPDLTRVKADIEKLATFVDTDKPGWTRRPFTPWYVQSRSWLTEQLTALGAEVRLDAASNLIGRIPGSDPALPAIMIGSHTDTVNGGGRFDGIIGVVAAIEILRQIHDAGITLRHSLELVDFTAEEPSEFGISTIGSRGMVGNLPKEMLERTDANGLVLQDALRATGGRPERINEEARKQGEIAAYLELHIEQGPSLEQSGNKLGVVTGIVGIHRYRVIVEGSPNHAGTTPMHLRQDALTGAAELVLALEHLCRKTYDSPVVGTVGKLKVEPNGANVIPGLVVFELEVRSIQDELPEKLVDQYAKQAHHLAAARGLRISIDRLSRSDAILVSDHVRNTLREACESTADTMLLPSGAGHDGNQLAAIAPIGMIFVPSKDGRSHCPEEWTDFEEVVLGIEALGKAVLAFDQGQEA